MKFLKSMTSKLSKTVSTILIWGLLWYFLSEFYFWQVQYILITHFFGKKCGFWKKSNIRNSHCMEVAFETIQSSSTPFSLSSTVFEKFPSSHKNGQHLCCTKNGIFWEGKICTIFCFQLTDIEGRYLKF